MAPPSPLSPSVVSPVTVALGDGSGESLTPGVGVNGVPVTDPGSVVVPGVPVALAVGVGVGYRVVVGVGVDAGGV